MELNFDTAAMEGYHSAAQAARVLTEKWVTDNMFCPPLRANAYQPLSEQSAGGGLLLP